MLNILIKGETVHSNPPEKTIDLRLELRSSTQAFYRILGQATMNYLRQSNP